MKMIAACNKYFRAMKPGTIWERTNHLVPTKAPVMGGLIPVNQPVTCRVVKRVPKDGILLHIDWLGEAVESWLFWPRPGGDISISVDTDDRIEVVTNGKPLLTYIRKGSE